MSLIPAFEIGVWNAWIFMLYLPLHPLLMILIDKAVGTGGIVQKMGSVPRNKSEKTIFSFSMALLFILLIYSIFLPLKLGTGWFYAGLAIYLLGVIMFIAGIVNVVTTPPGEPFTGGLYRFSRHPMTFFGFFTYIGTGIASASWVFLLLSVITILLEIFTVIPEERGCLELYGDSYRKYMDMTPRWIGLPK